MPDLPTYAELYDAGQAEIQRRNADLTDFSSGSNLDAVTGAGAVLADEVIRVLIDLFMEQFVDTAEGQDLDDLADDRFGLERKAASAAVGTVTFTRVSGVGVIVIPAGTTVSGAVDGDEVRFTTDAEVQIDTVDSTVDAAATCTETGREGNVAVGVIDTVVDEVGDDPDLTVTNAARFTGGAPEETDERFRDRIRRYLPSLRRATTAALDAGARTIPGVEYVTVNEDFVASEDGGYVAVYIGDPDARASVELVTAVENELENWRAAGVQVQVSAAEREEVSLSLEMTVLPRVDQTTLRTGVRQAVLEHINGLSIDGEVTGGLDVGETLHLSRVLARAMRVSNDIVGGEVTSHTDDIEPSQPHYAIRVPTTSLSISFVELT